MLGNSFGISLIDLLFAGKSGDEHQQGGTRQVEIGEHSIHCPEMMSGQDVQIGVARPGCGGLPTANQVRRSRIARRQSQSDLRCCLQCPHAGGPHSDDPDHLANACH